MPTLALYCELIRKITLIFALSLSGAAQNPLDKLPQNYRLTFENEQVRVLRVHYGPHEKLPVHSHSSNPTVYVYLSDSPPVSFSHHEDKPFTIVRHPLKAGTFRVSPGRIEVHSVENLGDTPSDFLRIELKKVPLGIENLAQRDNDAFDLSKTSDTVVYSRPQLTIERIICAGYDPCRAGRRNGPALLVALAPASMPQTLAVGDVFWIKDSKPVFVAGVNGVSAHFLRIEFPQ